MFIKYLANRTGQALLVLWAAFTASFVLLQLLPGDAILIKFLNPELGLGPQEIADIRAAYGADTSVWQQYQHTLLGFLSGNFGYSVQAGVPVPGLASAIAYFDAYRSERLPANLIQAQRDLFGAHTFERIDREGSFHADWN